MGIDGDVTFCLSKFKMKSKTRNCVFLTFWVNKVLHDTIKNQTKINLV
jgi:hypothetical protein